MGGDGGARGRLGWPTALGLAAGIGLDAMAADPRRGHPVSAFGVVAGRTERIAYRDSRLAGAAYAAALIGATAATGRLLSGLTGPRSAGRAAVVCAATWAVLGGTTLRREARGIQAALAAGDLESARAAVPRLCGRDPDGMDSAAIARAVVESLAENTSDAVVAPLLWGAIGGVPGLLGYRAANTLDAMVGYRTPRYGRFGWAAARSDDVANLVPARAAALLAVLLAPVVGGDRQAAARVWRRDGGKHPSPNAGQVEAAFAGALGRTLGGPVSYAGRREERPLLGDGPAPDVTDIHRAVALCAAVSAAAGFAAVALRASLDRR